MDPAYQSGKCRGWLRLGAEVSGSIRKGAQMGSVLAKTGIEIETREVWKPEEALKLRAEISTFGERRKMLGLRLQAGRGSEEFFQIMAPNVALDLGFALLVSSVNFLTRIEKAVAGQRLAALAGHLLPESDQDKKPADVLNEKGPESV